MEESKKTRDEFTSFEVAKALDISIERMRQWMNFGFIKPNKPATGRGTKSVFTREDVFRAALFLKQLEMGVNRKYAAILANMLLSKENLQGAIKQIVGDEATEILKGNIPKGKKDLLMVIIHPDKKENEKLGTIKTILIIGELPSVEEMTKDPKTNERFKWTYMTVINISHFMKSVAARLPE
jgi:hypothetical protein